MISKIYTIIYVFSKCFESNMIKDTNIEHPKAKKVKLELQVLRNEDAIEVYKSK